MGHIQRERQDLPGALSSYQQARLGLNASPAVMCHTPCLSRNHASLSCPLAPEAQQTLCTIEHLDSPQGAALLASMGHIRRLQNDLGGDEVSWKADSGATPVPICTFGVQVSAHIPTLVEVVSISNILFLHSLPNLRGFRRSSKERWGFGNKPQDSRVNTRDPLTHLP